MNWFDNLTIRRKLFLAFGALILLMIILTMLTAAQFSRIGRSFSNLIEVTVKRQTNLADALGTLALLRFNNISTAIEVDGDEIAQSLYGLRHIDYESACRAFLKYLNDFRVNALNDTSMTRDELAFRIELIDTVEKLFSEYFRPCYYIILAGIDSGDRAMVGEGLQESYDSATEMNEILNGLMETALAYSERETQHISAQSKNIVYTQFLIAAAIIVISIFVSFFMARMIEIPVYRLGKSASEIAKGNLSFPIRSDKKDEMGMLSNRIGDMVDSMIKANQAKSAFLANMSHEMRTPLNIVVGLTELRMESDGLPAGIQEDLKKIYNAGRLLLGIVNDVLDISKIEAGKLELTPVAYNTASMLNDIITFYMIRIDAKPIVFNVDVSEHLPSELYGDELRIKQILNNLLNNAFKYTNKGSVTLQLKCSFKDAKDTWVSASVSDTGIGIRPEDINKLFTDYNQVDTRANRKIQGTGLGLSITKSLVELMDGEISVESEYGKGSAFHVTIRQGSVSDNTIGADTVNRLRNFTYKDNRQGPASTLVRSDLSGARALVVDDFPTNLDLAASMLRKYNMHVDCVTGGQDAVELLRRGEPVYNAIFMDHMMPEMDGIEATRLIRGMDSKYARSVPIIALTANALEGNEQMFMDNGFTAFLSKPINILKLDSIINAWIKNTPSEESRVDESIPVSEKQEAEKQEATKMPAINIPGINADAGLELYGGEMDIYANILQSFVENTPAAIEKMKNVTMDNLPDYAITVHGLKSVSATVAAQTVNEKAKRLEAMAKAGDLAGVMAHNGELLRETQILVDDISAWLAANAGK